MKSNPPRQSASRTRHRLDGCDVRPAGYALGIFTRDDRGQDDEPELVRSPARDMGGRCCCCRCDTRGFGVSGGFSTSDALMLRLMSADNVPGVALASTGGILLRSLATCAARQPCGGMTDPSMIEQATRPHEVANESGN